jgi:hypothetical protein
VQENQAEELVRELHFQGIEYHVRYERAQLVANGDAGHEEGLAVWLDTSKCIGIAYHTLTHTPLYLLMVEASRSCHAMSCTIVVQSRWSSLPMRRMAIGE